LLGAHIVFLEDLDHGDVVQHHILAPGGGRASGNYTVRVMPYKKRRVSV
jgi:hypothetical protein